MKKVLLFLFMFILGNCVFALDYSVHKLENGQTVIVKQVKNNPIVIIDTWVKTGSINEDDRNNGVSHFLEHLFFKGTKNHVPGEFDKILESKGAETNASTSKDFTHYYITIPAKYFDMAMDLHADMLLNPLIPRKELEKERKVVMEEIAKDADTPQEKVYNNLIQMLYTTHPYKRKVIGTNEIIGKISREEILNYYSTHYGPQNMVTIVIGDVEPEHALKKVKEDFCVSNRKLTKNINKMEKPLISKATKVDYQDIQGGYMLIGCRGVNALDNDNYALDVLATILGDGRSSILYQIIKEQKQLAYSISANNSSYKEDGIFLINANFAPENYEKLQKAIFTEIEKIQKQGVTQEQLNLAQKIIETDTYYSRESVSNIASEIGYTTVLTDNPRYYDEYLPNIKKVSAEDVKRVACKYLGENKSAISVLLPKKNSAAEAKSDIKQVNAKFIKEIPGTQKFELDNGISLLMSQNDINDIIAMSIWVKGGFFLEKIPGVADMTASVMTKGTQKYSAIELAQLMEENGIKISPGATADTFTIDVLTTKPQINKTFDILNEIVNNASFNEIEIEKTKTAMLSSIKKTRDIPLNLALEEYRSMIYEGSVYSNGPKIYEKSIPKISREDILEYYSSIFNPNNIVVSVNGNITQPEITSLLANVFLKNPAEKFDYQKYSAKISPITDIRSFSKEIPGLQTSWLILGWQCPGVLNEKDCATLQVIDAMLGSGMSSRLFKNVRDKEGLAYQLGSSYSPKILKGAFTIYIGTNPKTLLLAKDKMLHEVNRLKREFVSDKELQEAKEKLIGKYILSQETNLEKASTVGWFEVSGRGFEFKQKYQKSIESVTASDIIEVANKYFGQNYAISVIKD